MTFALTGWMLYAMFAVLGFMGLSFLYNLYRSLKAGSFSSSLFLPYLKDLLYYVFPLFLLSNMMGLDPTGFLMLTGYYVGALGVVLKYLESLKK
ncbi:hypothetical protein [Paenibacillus planticolens]|uniref:Uncharacterized protein n=1 Tax=Paenibacillus planticolens TaxID=2654976 RepID=A0ABX1ZQ38_9BACL|nr:hypothetical protein [Paenibacillus planticolens]NOV02199.1 hypothetical protein [Paenibacillus planticolens]